MADDSASIHASAVMLSRAREDSATVQRIAEPRFRALLKKVGLEK